MTSSRSAAVLLLCCLGLTFSGCGSGVTNGPASSSPTPQPQVTLSATTLAFPATTVGQTSSALTATVTNSGTATLTFASAITLSDTADYTLTNSCSTTLAAGASCLLSITFKPQSATTFPATVTLTDNANGQANLTQIISLSGTGTAAAVPQASLSPSPLVITDTPLTTFTLGRLTLTNGGNAPLSVTSVAVTSTASPNPFTLYALSPGGCGSGTSFTLAAGSSCILGVSFLPTTTGPFTGTLILTDNAGGTAGATQSVTLTAKGIPAPTAPGISFSPAALTFPDTGVNTVSGSLPVTVTNTGTAALALSSIAVTGGATAGAFTQTNNCPATLGVGLSCTVSVTFAPTIAGSFQAALTFTDNAAASPQSVTLAGNSVAPAATLSSTSLAFPATTINTTSSALSSTLTNSGTATLDITSISLGGTNSNSFTRSTTCGATLAPGASCGISATFSPAAAQSYGALITVTTNAATSPQAIALSGTGTNAAVTYNLFQFPDPGTGPGSGGLAAIYALADNALSKIDMTMYAFQDTTFLNKLIAACARGVTVRVILDQNNEKSNDTPAYNALNAQTNCAAHWANKSFQVTHEKSIVADGNRMALMSLNLQSQYYSTTRDWAMIYNDAADIAAVEATFENDYAVNGGTDATEYAYQPLPGNDLIWSPTTAKQKMLDIINNATTTLWISNEELTTSANYITSAIVARCQAGVSVKVVIENESHTYDTQLTALKSGGCAPHYYYSSTGFYVHAKAVVADYGLPTQNAYMGSINYSNPSMIQNRELGMNIADQASVLLLKNAIDADYNNATVY